MTEQNERSTGKTFTEEIDIAASQLLEKVKSLLAEGNVRQLRIKAAGGEIILETPLTVGAIGGGAIVLAAPWLAIIGAIAGLVTRVKVEIVRAGAGGDEAGNDQTGVSDSTATGTKAGGHSQP
jgi:hypothetical protein